MAVFWYTSTADTDNTPSGPIADADCPPPYYFTHMGQPFANFLCNYNFVDSDPGGSGSMHRAIINVNPGGTSSTGWVTVGAGGSVSGTIGVGPIGYTPPPPDVHWEVEVQVWCYPINDPENIAYDIADCTIVCAHP